MIAAVLAVFVAASVLDLMGKDIPLWMFPLAAGFRGIYFCVHGTGSGFLVCTLSALILFLIYYIAARFGSMGGADCLGAAVLGFTLGYYGLFAAVAASVLSIPQAAFATRKKQAYPFLPYLLAGFLIVLAYLYIQGNEIPLFL